VHAWGPHGLRAMTREVNDPLMITASCPRANADGCIPSRAGETCRYCSQGRSCRCPNGPGRPPRYAAACRLQSGRQSCLWTRPAIGSRTASALSASEETLDRLETRRHRTTPRSASPETRDALHDVRRSAVVLGTLCVESGSCCYVVTAPTGGCPPRPLQFERKALLRLRHKILRDGLKCCQSHYVGRLEATPTSAKT
jgi:hypothetical protein